MHKRQPSDLQLCTCLQIVQQKQLPMRFFDPLDPINDSFSANKGFDPLDPINDCYCFVVWLFCCLQGDDLKLVNTQSRADTQC